MMAPAHTKPVADELLHKALQEALNVFFEREQPILRIERRVSPYRSSFMLEEVLVHFEGGARLPIIFKDISRSGLSVAARDAKPEFLYNSLREIFVYRQLLSPENLGTATCYGACTDVAEGHAWLFLAQITGSELYQIGDFEVWCSVARWLAAAQRQLSARLIGLAPDERDLLIDYDEEFFECWMTRALQFRGQPALQDVAARYATVVDHLLDLPRTFLHGDFYPSNILIQPTGEEIRICPIDWEAAAIGPGLIDLAALIAGNWEPDQRLRLARQYYTALGQQHPWVDDWPGFVKSLNYCRLHLAVQWLGWSPDWTPPAAHAQDWLGEALSLAGELNL